MSQRPLQIDSLEQARAWIAARIDAFAGQPRPVVAVGGPVGAGKSTLARMLGGLIVSTDDYLPDYEGLPEHERDEPSRADLARLSADLDRLRQFGQASLPTWCFQSHRRLGERNAVAEGLIVCEGIFALHPVVAVAADVRVLVVASRTTRWERWERIEQAGERGMGVDAAREHFDRIAEPTYDRHAELYKAGLDLIVRNEQA